MREKDISDGALFNKADSTNDGEVDLGEMKECLFKIGGFSEKEIGAIMRFIDVDGDGCIDKIEFLS